MPFVFPVSSIVQHDPLLASVVVQDEGVTAGWKPAVSNQQISAGWMSCLRVLPRVFTCNSDLEKYKYSKFTV